MQILPKLQFGQSLAGFFSYGSISLVGIFLSIILLTIFFGRFFCGFICPMGAVMDFTFFVRSKIKKRPFTFLPNRSFRMVIPGLILILFWFGLTLPFGELEPYSLFVSGPFLSLLILILTVFRGRAFCNSICPTGLVLKLFSGQSIFGFTLDKKTCLSCGACQKVCPASCLDSVNKTVDYGRCLVCLECASVCPNGSLKYSLPKAPNMGRRRFLRLAGTGALVTGAYLTGENLRSAIFNEPEPVPILPPGALSLAHLNAHCSLCHTCVRACPNLALDSSHSTSLILTGKPVLDPYKGFCQYDCLVCGEVCPTGALLPLSVATKKLTRLGLAKLNRLECVVVKNGTSCGACAELCPTGAVQMSPGPSGRDEPTMNIDYCIGCGACQKACPVRPVAAIEVQGLTFQQTAKPPVVEEHDDLSLTNDFPF
ncbi:MAG: 4Fe-4S dicluster domain-containing protein [Deltaproteobacteria bacterium]|jgi:polyferredoxin|nr:4Fe-4S dicluster domain-containing protein [Deltaproteobacteria bacterium]